jgi:ATP-dependent protease ClpP protease subunit
VTVQTDYSDCCPYIVQHTPNTRPTNGLTLFFHNQTSDILIKSKKAERTRKSLADILVKHTGRSDKEVGDALERDTYMSASEAVGFGIVDREIVSVGEIGGK